MAIIKPFKGIRYNKAKIKRLKGAFAPPYDVISPKAQEALYAASPYNVVRLIFGKKFPGDQEGENRYTRAKDFLSKWLDKNILVREAEPAVYIYGQDYREGRARKRRLGFIALMKLE